MLRRCNGTPRAAMAGPPLQRHRAVLAGPCRGSCHGRVRASKARCGAAMAAMAGSGAALAERRSCNGTLWAAMAGTESAMAGPGAAMARFGLQWEAPGRVAPHLGSFWGGPKSQRSEGICLPKTPAGSLPPGPVQELIRWLRRPWRRACDTHWGPFREGPNRSVARALACQRRMLEACLRGHCRS